MINLAVIEANLILSIIVWFTTIIGVFLIGFWMIEVVFLSSRSLKDDDYGPDEVQVRIITIDDQKTVEETLSKLDSSLDDVHVIAENHMNIDRAKLHVVPDNFECNSEKKGRALEWANRNVETDREFVLYLDEDSHLDNFTGLPDRDIVQLREKPRYTGSMISYVSDVLRMGIQLEQLAFPNLRIPLFAWGGGIAVKRDTEKKVSWNRPSLVEDTSFVWKASSHGASFGVSDIYVRNEAPPSIMALLEQRRRWAGGNHIESKELDQPYRTLQRWRNFSWGFTPVSAMLVPLMLFLISPQIIFEDLAQVIGSFLFAVTPTWYILGVLYYRKLNPWHIPGILLAYPGSIIHGLGAGWGIISPLRTFNVTPKKKSVGDVEKEKISLRQPAKSFLNLG